MSLMQAVENYLGDVGTWPSYIITYLFAETPLPRVVEELTAFFAGNGVPKTLAYKFYCSCNPEAITAFAAAILHAVFLVALFRHRPTSLRVL